MAQSQSPFRRRWTLTAWSCLGAIGVTTLLFVAIFEAHGSRPEAGMQRPAIDRQASETRRN